MTRTYKMQSISRRGKFHSRHRHERRSLTLEHLEQRQLLAIDFLPGDMTAALAVNDQQQVAVERGGSGYLAVWTDERAVLSGFVNTTSPLNGNGQDIYGQLLDLNGQPVGAPIVIANSGHNQSNPDLAWNESAHEWLVVFDSQDPEWYFHDQVYGVRVAADGSVLDSEPQLIFEQDGNQGIVDVDVASDGTNWAVIASKFQGTPLEGSIIGRRLAADGSQLDLQPKVFVAGDLMMPEIAYANGTYMIAARDRVTNNIFVTPTDSQLNPTGPTTFVGPGAYPGPRLATNGTDFMLVGNLAYRIDSSGQILDPSGIAIGGSASISRQRDVVWSGSEWSIGMRTSNGDIGLQRIGADGSLIDSEPVISDVDAMDEQVAIAGAAGRSIVVFSDRPAFDQDIRGVVFDAGMASSPIDVSIGLGRQSRVTAVDGPGGENLAVFVRHVSGEIRLLSQRIADDGSVLDAEPTVVAVLAATASVTPNVAWNGSVYLVTWANYAQRLSPNNQLIDLQPILVSDNTLHVRAVAAAGDTFVTTLTEPTSIPGPSNIWIVRVAGDGTVVDGTPQFLDTGSPRHMTAASFGDKVIVGWGLTSTRAAIIQADASFIGPFVVSNGRGTNPRVAVHGNQALFVYEDQITSADSNIEGRFVYSDGSMPEFEFPISVERQLQNEPSVAWIGDQYLVAWSDYRHVTGVQQLRADIRAARITSTGILRDPKGFTVTRSAEPEDWSAVVGGGGHSWILFSALHEVDGSPGVQRIGYQYGPLVDYPVATFQRVGIPGGFASVSAGNVGVLAEVNEVHHYEVDVAAGERATAIVTPTNPLATITAGFAGQGNPTSAAAPGAAVVVPLAALPEGGRLTLNITANMTTSYEFEVRRNQNVQSLFESNQPVAIDDAALPLGRNSQYAAIGQLHGQLGGAGFDHYHDPSLFVDISTTGTSLVMDDGFYGRRAFVNTTVGNDLLPAGTITVAIDGVIVEGFRDIYLGANQTIPDSFYLGPTAALAPYWALLGANTGGGIGNGAVYVEERLVDGIETLIVQWEDVPAWHNLGAGTFQVQVFASGPVKSRFVYQDVTFGDPNVDGGRTASIGLQLDGTTGYQFSYRTPSVTAGDVIDFLDLPTIEDVDDMTVTFVAGESIDIAISGVDHGFTTDVLELIDSFGTVLAHGSATYNGQPIENFDQGILGFIVPADGTYTVRVRGTGSLRYELLVTRELAIELESAAPAAIRSLDGTTGALGALSDRPSLSGYSHYNDPGLFVDIAQTGTELFFDHSDGVTPVYTNIGNALMPAGKFLVGFDGALMMDEDLDAFSGYGNPTLPNDIFEFSALVPFWTDLYDVTGAVYVDQRILDGVNTLIVQWDNMSYFFESGTGTFQVQLFDRDPSAARQLAARFVYADVNFDNPLYNNGIDATVGVQLDRSTAELVSHHLPSIADGDVIDFYIELGDRFPVAVAAGETVTLHTLTPLDGTQIVPPNLLDPAIAILDEFGNILASDSNSVDGKNAGLEFTAPVAGNYRIAIYAEGGHGEYVIQTTPGASLRDGDFDNDGQYTARDVDQMTQHIINFSQDPVFDLSGDRRVTTDDLTLWLAEAGAANLPSQSAYLPADANLDGIVDGLDFNLWNANKFQVTGRWSLGDFNADGFTDGLDFTIWNAYKFQTAGQQPQPVDDPLDSNDSVRQAWFADFEKHASVMERESRLTSFIQPWRAADGGTETAAVSLPRHMRSRKSLSAAPDFSWGDS